MKDETSNIASEDRLALVVIFLSILSLFLALLAAVALAAFLSLLAQHYIHIPAPVLANFPPRPGEGAIPPEGDE